MMLQLHHSTDSRALHTVLASACGFCNHVAKIEAYIAGLERRTALALAQAGGITVCQVCSESSRSQQVRLIGCLRKKVLNKLPGQTGTGGWAGMKQRQEAAAQERAREGGQLVGGLTPSGRAGQVKG